MQQKRVRICIECTMQVVFRAATYDGVYIKQRGHDAFVPGMEVFFFFIK